MKTIRLASAPLFALLSTLAAAQAPQPATAPTPKQPASSTATQKGQPIAPAPKGPQYTLTVSPLPDMAIVQAAYAANDGFAGVSCGKTNSKSTCSASFPAGTVLKLRAVAGGKDFDFKSWSGACAGTTGEYCTVTMNQNINVGAVGAPKVRFTLEAVRPGVGTIRVYPGRETAGSVVVKCGGPPADDRCKNDIDAGTVLTASIAGSSGFRGWGSLCPGTATTCTFTMDKNITIDIVKGPPVAAAPVWPREMMTTGDHMAVGQYLLSNNKGFYAIQQADGNLCVYRGSGPSDSKGAVWCHQQVTPNAPPPYVTVMQTDGNFCTYRGTSTQYISLNWCTHKVAPGGKYFAVLENGGNLCVYKGTGWSDNQGNLWCSTVSAAVIPSSGTPVAPPPKADIYTPPRDRPEPRLPVNANDEFLMVNDTPNFVWVTVYRGSPLASQHATACVAPWGFVHLKGSLLSRTKHEVRAEMTSTENCASLPNNRHVLCDTRSDVATSDSLQIRYSKVTLKANAQKCWWENYTFRY